MLQDIVKLNHQCPDGFKTPDVAKRTFGSEASHREQMIEEHLPMVYYIARAVHKRLPQQILIEDLVSAGLIGLLDAVDKFVSRKNAQFGSYAQFRIRGAIVDSLRQTDWGSRRIRRRYREINQAIVVLTDKLGRVPSDDEVAKELDLDVKTLQKTMCESRELEVDWLQSTEVAAIPDRDAEDPLSRLLSEELRRRLAGAIASLGQQEQRILTMYYLEERKQKEIAKILGVTESRISQVRGSAISHLRIHLTS